MPHTYDKYGDVITPERNLSRKLGAIIDNTVTGSPEWKILRVAALKLELLELEGTQS